MAVQALAGTQTITSLADEFDVNRKFVYQQAATAQAALDDAFTARPAEPVPILLDALNRTGAPTL